MKLAPVFEAPVLLATNTIVASTGATSTVALVLTPVLPALVLLAANTFFCTILFSRHSSQGAGPSDF